ncbi:hypothetical protein PHMEG_0006308 [Phytophthora megakarya]|uniref:DDE-1 domain-containing protein n=1 Tax=Phytophthora megakarya TaxID=4795 RepID=A0A225WP38_9STRA|nr:hypothetical protein PHMEG_0006308 [Phytophthora megakarya]
MTAVLTVRDDGYKLPILFIIRGVPGAFLEKNELKEYPDDHFYAVQENAWMDASIDLLSFSLTILIVTSRKKGSGS